MSRILIVDDEPTIVEGLQALLELYDFRAEGASDRESAEALIEREFFPIILSDVRMRREDDGLRLLDAVKRLSPRSRVAAMTAYADAALVCRLRERGAQLVLQKPVSGDELMAALREMLAAVEVAEAAHAEDDEALYAATLRTLQQISRGRYGFTREDAEELVQEAWLLFLEKRRSIRSPRVWLSGTVANLCRQEIDRRVRSRARIGEMPDDVAVFPAGHDAIALHQALGKLDDRSRALCTLIGLEQRSYEEVSTAIDLPIGSVGPMFMRAKERLRNVLVN